jgi:hypothetical protein
MLNQLMEDTCLKDMQATKLSSLKTEKHLQVHRLPKALRSMEWTSSSSGIHCSTLPFSSSSKIFTILISTGASAPTSILRPSLSRQKSSTSVQSADTTSFPMITWIRHALCVLKKLKNGARNILRNNNTPAAHPTRLDVSPGFKQQAASYKRLNFS